jgi:peptidoglycan/xylan/chitin deacetylase (PgdA/CDA1 family)
MTMDMPRDFIGYGAHPPQFEWPGGGRLAVNLVINYEEGSERSPLDGDTSLDTASEPLAQVAPVEPGRTIERPLISESVYEYGSRVAIWRLIELFDRYAVPASIFACALALERNPPVTQAFVDRGYDLVGHGYRWLSHHGLSPEEERAQIRMAVASIQRMTGQRILGWFTNQPQTPATRRLLAEEGFLFDSGAVNDDVPYFQVVAERPFLIVPYSIDINDFRFWRTPLTTAREFEEYCRDSFDVLYRESARSPRMMSIGLHARVIGRPGRILALERFLAHVREFPGVWVTTRTQIARFWAERFAPPNTWNWPS